MEIDQLYVEKHHQIDDLHLPVKNSLAHTVSAMLSKLNLCDPRKVLSYPEHGQTFTPIFPTTHLNLVQGDFFIFQFFYLLPVFRKCLQGASGLLTILKATEQMFLKQPLEDLELNQMMQFLH